MKLIDEKPPACPCQHKLWDFYDQAGRTWGIGTKVECDCGQQYVLAESQGDGKFWQRLRLRDKITMTVLS